MDMKFELKNVAYNKRLSQETPAFAADVWLNGKKAGTADNSGRGGMTMVHLHLLNQTERAEVAEWVKNQRTQPSGDGPIEDIVDALFAKWEAEKQERTWCKTKVVFRLKGKPAGEYVMFKKGPNKLYTKADKEHLVKQYGDTIEEIINEKLGEVAV